MNERVGPIERLSCNGRPFGMELARAYADNPNSQSPLPEAEQLQDALCTLYHSSDKTDQQAVRQINRFFETNDRHAYNFNWFAWQEGDGFGRDDEGKPNIVAWLIATDLRTLGRFALSNEERYYDLDLSLDNSMPLLNSSSLEATQRLIELGLMPDGARAKFTAVNHHYTHINAMDSFEAGASGSYAYQRGSYIAMSNLYESRRELQDIGRRMFSVAYHEKLHADGTLSGRSFSRGICNGRRAGIIEEIVVAHTTEVAFAQGAPDPDILSPLDRDGDEGDYPRERHLGQLLAIPPDLLVEARMSKREAHVRQLLEYLLVRNFRRYTGGDFFEFCDTYAQVPHSVARIALVDSVISTIEGTPLQAAG